MNAAYCRGKGDGMRRKNLAVSLVALALVTVLAALTAQAQNKTRVTDDLYLDWEFVSNPEISPDGTEIIYSHRWVNKVEDKYENDVWIVNSDGTKNRFLIKGARLNGRRTVNELPT
jgi:Tol biopolymer transport system component